MKVAITYDVRSDAGQHLFKNLSGTRPNIFIALEYLTDDPRLALSYFLNDQIDGNFGNTVSASSLANGSGKYLVENKQNLPRKQLGVTKNVCYRRFELIIAGIRDVSREVKLPEAHDIGALGQVKGRNPVLSSTTKMYIFIISFSRKSQ